MWVLTIVTTPLQGLLNFLVFVRPRVIAYLEAEPNLTLAQAFMKAVMATAESTTPRVARRRRSLHDTQQNGGRRYTAREFHMRERRSLVALDAEIEAEETKKNIVTGPTAD